MSNDISRFPNIATAVGSGEADALAVIGVLMESETSAKQWKKTVRNKYKKLFNHLPLLPLFDCDHAIGITEVRN